MTIFNHPFFHQVLHFRCKNHIPRKREIVCKMVRARFTPFWTGSWVSPACDSGSDSGFLAVADYDLFVEIIDLRTIDFAPDDRLKRTLEKDLSHYTYCSI
jgi:hypothetical protein